MTEFEGVIPALGQALTKRGYTDLTPVQKAVLAPELRDADALVSAQTGSGKTVAFGMALAPTLLDGRERFDHAPVPLALVVAPTRELALQVKRELDWLYEITGATVASCVGGMDMRTERRTLERGAHIVVGTPGRLCDHIKRGSFNTSGLKAVVLDEADEMLDLGFRDELEEILDASPSDRRTLMFSATVPRTIATLAKRYQRNAVRVSTTAEREQHLDIDYRALSVSPNDRENAIINVLRYYDAKNALVFCATRATVNHMTSRFNNRGFSVVALSGELSQNERSHALQAMRDGRARVCIATDVAARGIDLPNLELVIHADLPKNRETLLHRSGRTGRAGRKGVCALIVPHSFRKRTERLLGSANVEATWVKPPSAEDIIKRDRERLFEDANLTEALNEDEQAFAKELLQRFSPEQVAGAFMRLHSAGQSAPEELIDTGPVGRPERGERKERSFDDFKGSVWISLSVGRDHRAEPRWLLPMLCKAGGITKNDIGAIKIHQTETHVEMKSTSVDKFLEAVGPGRTLEKSITVNKLDGAPKAPVDKPKGSYRDKPYEKKKPYAGKPAGERKPASDSYEPMRNDAPMEAPRDKSREKSKENPYVKPWDRSAKKSKGKKPGKPKFAGKPGKFAGKDKATDNSGASPLMRKKPRKKAD